MTMIQDQTGILNVEGFRLSYCIEGKGADILVIGSAIYYPRTFSQNLRKNFRFIFIDHRGFAEKSNVTNADELTFHNILDDIETMRKRLGLSSFILIGHSGHGYMALEYAKKYPKHISHLVLLAMSPDSSPGSFAAANLAFQESVCPERKSLLEKNLSTLQTAITQNPDQAFIIRMLQFAPMIWYDPHFDASHLWKDVKVVPEINDYLWGKVFREIDITQNLKKLNIPVFLGLGRYDYWNPPYLWEKMRPYFNDLTIRIFEKSGHTPQLEEPDLFDNELLQWLSTKRWPNDSSY